MSVFGATQHTTHNTQFQKGRKVSFFLKGFLFRVGGCVVCLCFCAFIIGKPTPSLFLPFLPLLPWSSLLFIFIFIFIFFFFCQLFLSLGDDNDNGKEKKANRIEECICVSQTISSQLSSGKDNKKQHIKKKHTDR